jgi:tRNA guanosine-2'-O-methyltransferase
MGGNWIVGNYKIAFFNSGDDFILRQVLAAAIPWLSSTQGFSRAIAQLLVHALIPLVLNVDDGNESLADSDWFLRLVYRFLNENREMKRLRTKQIKFFESYSVEDICTPEGVLSIPVDEGDEADPVHLVDAMKETLQVVYSEAHESDKPDWKQVEEMLQSENGADTEISPDEPNSLVNFQRKIIPLDSLNLAMEDLREKRIRNAAGHRKQQLIVCASLVDKIPNLGGLARTSEIFSANRLVIPDKAVCKMDMFKSLSVGAGDWIDIEEVREEVGDTHREDITCKEEKCGAE